MGPPHYTPASRVLMTADCGSSDGDRVRRRRLALKPLRALALTRDDCHGEWIDRRLCSQRRPLR